MDGATLVEVKELLGHHDITMTMRYAHLAPGRLRDAVGRLDRVFGEASRGCPDTAGVVTHGEVRPAIATREIVT